MDLMTRPHGLRTSSQVSRLTRATTSQPISATHSSPPLHRVPRRGYRVEVFHGASATKLWLNADRPRVPPVTGVDSTARKSRRKPSAVGVGGAPGESGGPPRG